MDEDQLAKLIAGVEFAQHRQAEKARASLISTENSPGAARGGSITTRSVSKHLDQVSNTVLFCHWQKPVIRSHYVTMVITATGLTSP
jgi:hypothetical protein